MGPTFTNELSSYRYTPLSHEKQMFDVQAVQTLFTRVHVLYWTISDGLPSLFKTSKFSAFDKKFGDEEEEN